jgi:hypothetical protein
MVSNSCCSNNDKSGITVGFSIARVVSTWQISYRYSIDPGTQVKILCELHVRLYVKTTSIYRL